MFQDLRVFFFSFFLSLSLSLCFSPKRISSLDLSLMSSVRICDGFYGVTSIFTSLSTSYKHLYIIQPSSSHTRTLSPTRRIASRFRTLPRPQTPFDPLHEFNSFSQFIFTCMYVYSYTKEITVKICLSRVKFLMKILSPSRKTLDRYLLPHIRFSSSIENATGYKIVK